MKRIIRAILLTLIVCVLIITCSYRIGIHEDVFVREIVREQEELKLKTEKEEELRLIEEEKIAKAEKEIEDELKEEERIKNAPKAYLTFDDGPSSNTDKIIEILDSYGVNATFFVVYKALSPSLDGEYLKIVEHGNSIGLHSYSHIYDKIYATEESFVDDIDKIQTLVYDKTGVMSHIYRFPGGSSVSLSNWKINRFLEIVSEKELEYFDWNIDSGDTWIPSPPSSEIVNNVLSRAEGKEEVVILMHDLGNKSATVEALPLVIEGLEEKGFVILPITDETIPVHHIEGK